MVIGFGIHFGKSNGEIARSCVAASGEKYSFFEALQRIHSNLSSTAFKGCVFFYTISKYLFLFMSLQMNYLCQYHQQRSNVQKLLTIHKHTLSQGQNPADQSLCQYLHIDT